TRRSAGACGADRPGSIAAAGAWACPGGDAAAARSHVPARAARPAAACACAHRGGRCRLRPGHGRACDGAGAAGPAAVAGACHRAAGPAGTLACDLAPAWSGGMSVVAVLVQGLHRVRRRVALDALLAWLPLPLALATLLWRWAGAVPALAAATLALLGIVAVLLRRLR